MTDWTKDHIPDPRDTSFTEDLGKVESTVKTLTFDQAREAGRHAQRDLIGGRYWDYEPDSDYNELTLHLPLDEVREPGGAYELPADGWHHARGCDCEFCRS